MSTRRARLTCRVLGPLRGGWNPVDGEWKVRGDIILEKRRDVAEASATVDDEWFHVVCGRMEPAAELGPLRLRLHDRRYSRSLLKNGYLGSEVRPMQVFDTRDELASAMGIARDDDGLFPHESDWIQDGTGFGFNHWLVTAAGATRDRRWLIAYELGALLGGPYLEDELDLLWELASKQPWYRPAPGVTVDIERHLGPWLADRLSRFSDGAPTRNGRVPCT